MSNPKSNVSVVVDYSIFNLFSVIVIDYYKKIISYSMAKFVKRQFKLKHIVQYNSFLAINKKDGMIY